MAFPALHQPPRLLRWMAAGVVALPLAATAPVQAEGQGLKFPRNGVICDRGTNICYDRNGVSYSQTRREFGSRAEQNLRRQLSGRPWPNQLVFSSGELCELQRQVCWDDGGQRRNVSKRLSRQLFGSSWNSNAWTNGNNNWQNGNNNWNNGNNNWNNGNNNWQNGNTRPGQQLSRCELSQRGQQLFSGECGLRQRATGDGTAYVVELSDGRRYAFRNRQGQLVLNDAANLWPAQFYSRGNDLIFRWADLQLVTRPTYDYGYGTGPSQRPLPWNQAPTGQFIQDLFNNLFR
ncbi:hypothetical protein KBZ20_00870 [Vulcanococcus limneticus Candia 3F8]|uniref:YcgJ family protein n=1 Tax=Vulcanococcus limneticus TaxID=2170428 RepID=UPI000B9902A5|nr:YcgJ family protein [Vulcanococcus limneticus]MCP9790449.1 hypothetical protein [Vulcanococcus limneticus MW73D5]MCP9892330.1 hypothetical protein [Vulcanococcus limneticus Candia 3F8]MCP9895848.1 hypothetical protein [Vulcanococcus limneticus Candia 3B3]